MFLVAAALVVVLADHGCRHPGQVVDLLSRFMGNPTLLLIAIMVLVMIVGTALDMTPTILILTPVLMPIIKAAGIDPVYFGVLFIINNSIGLITPPVGVVLNVVAGVARISMDDVTKGVIPFMIAQFIVHVRDGAVPAAGDDPGALVLLTAPLAGGALRDPTLEATHDEDTPSAGTRREPGRHRCRRPGRARRDPRRELAGDHRIGRRPSATARLAIREFSGDWIGAAGRTSATGSACAGKKLPITVQASTAGALEFTAWGAQVSPRNAPTSPSRPEPSAATCSKAGSNRSERSGSPGASRRPGPRQALSHGRRCPPRAPATTRGGRAAPSLPCRRGTADPCARRTRAVSVLIVDPN